MKFNPTIFYAHRTMNDINDVNRLISDIKIMGWPTTEQCEKFYEQVKSTNDELLIDYYRRCVYDKQGNINITTQHTSNTTKKKKVSTYAQSSTTCQGKNLRFRKGEIYHENFVMKTQHAFAVHKSIMRMVRGQYRVMLCRDKTFYFEKGDLPRLLLEVEKACHLYISCQLKDWIKEKHEELSNYIAYVRDINFKMFVEVNTESFNEITGSYDLILKDIPFIVYDFHNKHNRNPYFGRGWEYEYHRLVRGINNVPAVYKESYIEANPNPLHSVKINRAFKDEILSIISKTCSYTTDDYALDELYNRTKRGFEVHIKKTNDISEHSILLPFLPHSFEIEVKQKMNFGKLFNFSKEGLQAIEETISKCECDKYTKFKTQLERCLILIKGEVKNDHCIVWHFPYHGYGELNLLYDINDDRYKVRHPRCDELFNGYVREKCSHILYFIDPNAHYSSDTNYPFRCYLLVRGNIVTLFSANRDFSTLVFKVDDKKLECAIFLIWSYFSSYLCNKREGKSFRIEYLFKHFGIVPCYWRLDPIANNEDGTFDFTPYYVEEIIRNQHWY